ncbi:cytochrome P450 4d2 [Agrilus planipennis]|uniref:Cytochrome P450 4d2 n=1 Tax=Agrilus planipennis TaxID=224129 RepID=A0A7F5R664_AGRPL|nr:cytochrome P450 4d2 [Agrilus planipennis]
MVCRNKSLPSEGYRWRSHRKIITPAFHFKILESFIDVFEKNCSILIKKFEQEVGKNSFDVYPYVTLLALDIICETALGTEVYAQTNAHSEYVESVKDMCRIIMERTFNPFLQNDFIYKLSSIYRREKKALKILHNLTLSVLQTKRKRLLSNGSLANQDECLGIKKKLAFLDLLLQATVDGKPLSDTDLREEVDTFMFEGHDTTASAISFILYMLSKHKDVQEKIIQELNMIYADDTSRSCNHADLLQMKYLEAVIKETLRLYPSVPLFARQATEDIIYENTLIPCGTRLSIFAFGIMRDPDLFPEPEKFDPDRFLYKTRNVQFPYAYIPFSAGPRNCIGQKFAMLEMKATISKILRVYEILPAEPVHELLLSPETTLKSANGIHVKIEKRKYALGTKINAQTNRHSEYVKSVKFMCELLMLRVFTPYLHSEFLFQFSSLYQKEKKALKVLHSMTESIIQQRTDDLKTKSPLVNDEDGIGIKKKLAFLDLLLKSKLEGSNLSDREIREEVDTFMFEGHDTVSSAISFTIHCLSKNPHVQEKILEEIRSICGFDRNYSFSYTDLQNMKYLEATIKEGLRLYPSVPIYGRTFAEDIEFDGILYPKGTIAIIFAYGMARDEKIFSEPEKFDPDRFLNYNTTNQYPYAYLPFSAGPRNCIGQKYAMLEIKFTLAKFLLNYEVLPAIPEQQPILVTEATLKSANGVNIRIKRRNFMT